MKQKLIKGKTFWICYVVCILAAAMLPKVIKSTFAMNAVVLSLIWSIMGIGWNFIGGYAGQISNGHALFYAIGAYAVAICSDSFGMSPWVSMWIGMGLSAIVAFLLGKPLLRLNGAYFLIATMAAAECVRVICLNAPALGGATGIMFLDKVNSQWYSLQFKDKGTFFYLLLAITSLLVLLAKNKNVAFTREQLLNEVWGSNYLGETRTIDVHIGQLRKKLDLADVIKTIPKIGYRLEE